MRRFVTLVFLLLFTIPFGISISGCSKKTATVFCNGGDSGPVVGQLFSIALQPKLYGISLNNGEIGQVSQPASTDCKGSAVTVNTYIYGTTDMTLADVEPSNGRLCAGTWNRNTGGGIADYTTCNPTGKSGIAYITASAQGAASNPIAVYVHPVVTSVVLGAPSTDCTGDPATNCAPTAINSSVTNASLSCPVSGMYPNNPLMSNGCCMHAPSVVLGLPTFSGLSCVSQTNTALLTSRIYSGTIAQNNQQNISCQAGYLTYTPQTSAIVSIDQNGVATAQAPGSTVITATLSNAGSSAGFFATCPPASITLSTPSGSNNITVNQNFTQAITPTVLDTNGVTLTGVTLSYVSTTPMTLPSSATPAITPIFPGAGAIVAMCQPPACNPSPFNQIGLFGNGTPVVSNALNVTTPGTNTTVLYIGSTQSQYIVPVDFTSSTLGAPVRLPYVPNSMVISNDGSTIYMGSATELMTFNATTNSLSNQDLTASGPVLAISPDGSTLVISDPIRQLVYLYGSTGGITTSYGGVGTHAEFSPDSSTVYITAGNQILVHSAFTGWTSISSSAIPATDVAVAVPDLGAFFAGTTTTARGNCPVTTVTSSNGQPSTTNVLYPDAAVTGPQTDRLAATNDGKHVVGVTVSSAGTATLTDLSISSLNTGSTAANAGACPANGTALKFTTTPVQTVILPGITAGSITGVVPSSDSSNVFVTYAYTGAAVDGTLPLYQPAATGAGTLSSVTLSTSGATAPLAPVAGVFSSDNLTFYTGTTGDNLVHILTKSGSSFADTTKPINPLLPGTTGTFAPPNLLVQKPRKLL